MSILLYSPLISNRLNYIIPFIFNKVIGIDCQVTQKITDYQSFGGIHINYSNASILTNEIHINPHSLLFEKNIYEQAIFISEMDGFSVFFNTQTATSFPFDILACSFYMLSRYEEYLPYDLDIHQRFSGHQSLAFQAGFLEHPILHQWISLLVKAIQKLHPTFQPRQHTYTFFPTYDIDMPWAFRHRGLRGWGRSGLDFIRGNWPLLKARYKALNDEKTDPYFCFNTLENNHRNYGIRPQIFWLVANASRHDINPDYRLAIFQNLIRKTSQWSDTGLHPSYQSNEQSNEQSPLLKQEKNRLESILNQPITHSRQHFLRLQLPQTYRQLINAGIEHDYSMGFADKIGYRAGTGESFLWYDLEKEETTNLHIHPFVAMDVSLKKYEGLTPEQAQSKLQELQAYCQKNGLNFRTLWHNSSFSDLHGWEGWGDVYWSLFK